jgi:hypothetical protein
MQDSSWTYSTALENGSPVERPTAITAVNGDRAVAVMDSPDLVIPFPTDRYGDDKATRIVITRKHMKNENPTFEIWQAIWQVDGNGDVIGADGKSVPSDGSDEWCIVHYASRRSYLAALVMASSIASGNEA